MIETFKQDEKRVNILSRLAFISCPFSDLIYYLSNFQFAHLLLDHSVANYSILSPLFSLLPI